MTWDGLRSRKGTAPKEVIPRLRYGRPQLLSFSFDGRYLAGVTADGKRVAVYDLKTMKEVRVLNLPVRGNGGALALSPDGKRLAIRQAYSDAELFDVGTGRKMATFGLPVCCWAFSPDGKFLAGWCDWPGRVVI